MLSSILEASSTTSISFASAIFYAVAAAILGLAIAFTYMKTGRVSKHFARTLIVLPVLVCVVMLVVNGNLGTSVAVLGAFSLIRFRSLQGTSREIGFIFFAMTIGITCSIGYLTYAVAITALVCALHFVLWAVRFGENKTRKKELRITIPENLDYADIFDDLFEKYTLSHELVRVKTTNMGSMYELTYHTQVRDDVSEKEFLDDIRCRNGNLTVICGWCDYNPLEEL